MDYNENSFTSHLPQPSRLPSPGKGLFEISASANNARSTSMMPPPGTISRKHKESNLPEPAPKRKTLAERGGETAKTNLVAPPSSRLVNPAVKATALAGPPRNTSFSSSVSSRTPSVSSRNASGSSFSASVGPGNRPPSAQSFARPQTPLSNPRGSTHTPTTRPATSLENHDGGLIPGKRKGMGPISMSPYQKNPKCSIRLSKQRGSYDNQMNYTTDWSSSKAAGSSTIKHVKSAREFSLTTAMRGLTLESQSSSSDPLEDENPATPSSRLPRPVTPAQNMPNVSLVPTSPYVQTTSKSSQRSPPKILPFLTRESRTQAWDTKGRLEDVETMYRDLRQMFDDTKHESSGLKETIGLYKTRSMSFLEIRSAIQEILSSNRGNPHTSTRLTHLLVAAVNELESLRAQLSGTNITLRNELESTKSRLSTTERTLKDATRDQEIEIDDLKRQHRIDLETCRQKSKQEVDRLLNQHEDDLRELKRRLESQVEEERSQRIREIGQISTQGALENQKCQIELENKEREVRTLKTELEQRTGDLDRERALNKDLRLNLSTAARDAVTLDSSMRALKSRIHYLESDSKSQSDSFGQLQQQLSDAIAETKETNEKLRKEETLRRKLHNQVQELKGNIRVYCRVRPSIEAEAPARISFPDATADSKEIEVLGPEEKSSLGNITTKTNAFAFDRVFGPASQNADVFEEISQLVQSALDGYNVCIFCYGQTGSGKTFTMSADDGMIPRGVHQIYSTAKSLEEKGWRYSMEGSFVEVYNENLNDLLGRPEEFEKKKHDIRHDMQKCKTTITDIATVVLDSPTKVESILKRATANRSVAATKANERSSRSHSVFILKLIGENSITREKSEGTLNLVDLAGSERLSHSGSTGERLKETQNINRSLSCLGDVIGALGLAGKDGHVPYRNSKLTYLLQFSLGGNSKTLMFVMISSLQAHLQETLTSLKFATKVHNTHIGTAKKQTKVKE